MLETLPAEVDKKVLGGLVDVEDLVSEEAEAGAALQGQLPQAESCRVVVQSDVAQQEPN